jgi:hypothetical protein
MTERGASRLAALALAALCLVGCNSPDTATGATDATVTIRRQPVDVEVVTSREAQALGLGGRNSLAWGSGMLFRYERPAFASFWMKGMRFDIDIVWIRDRRVVGISPRVPHPPDPDAAPASIRPPEMVDMVLEVPAGYAEAHGWTRGDRATLSSDGI